MATGRSFPAGVAVNELKSSGNGGERAPGPLCHAEGPLEQIGRDAVSARPFCHIMAVEDQPSAVLHRLCGQFDDLRAIKTCILQRPGVERAKVGESTIDAGVPRAAGIEARFEMALGAN